MHVYISISIYICIHMIYSIYIYIYMYIYDIYSIYVISGERYSGEKTKTTFLKNISTYCLLQFY